MHKLMELEALIKTVEAVLEITIDVDISVNLMLEPLALVKY